MMKSIISLCIGVFLSMILSVSVQAQNKDNVWKQLSMVTFKKQYDEFMGFKVDIPVFSESIKALENKEIILKGYIIPTDGYKSHKEFVFSKYPYSNCFFCGGAGPETVMEVEALEGIRYTVEPITIKGMLQLNDKDINRLMYKLIKVQQVK